MIKDKLIGLISAASDRYGDKLIEFLTEYNLNGLQDATVAQLTEYIEKNHIGGKV